MQSFHVVSDGTTRPLDALDVGDGPVLVVLPGFAMQPRTYLPTARRLEERARVVIPDVFALPGPWRFDRALDCIEATLDARGIDRFSLVGHSFSGGLVLGIAVRRPETVRECIFTDTLADSDRFRLAYEVLHHPLGILALATPRATRTFVSSWRSHPLQLAAAALWGFLSDRRAAVAQIVRQGTPAHVLWANHDTLLSRADGRAFAEELHATFTVADGERVEHDWIFEEPGLFVSHLDTLPLLLWSAGRETGMPGRTETS